MDFEPLLQGVEHGRACADFYGKADDCPPPGRQSFRTSTTSSTSLACSGSRRKRSSLPG